MSQLRCRPGDLAVVVGPGVETPGLAGRFVIVEELVYPGQAIVEGFFWDGDCEGSWLCRSAAQGSLLPVFDALDRLIHLERRVIDDTILRPIRPNDGEDESLQWARRPQDIAITRPEAWDYQAYARDRAGEEV